MLSEALKRITLALTFLTEPSSSRLNALYKCTRSPHWLRVFSERLLIYSGVMQSNSLPVDTVAAIVLGIFQLGIGTLSLWQQRQIRKAYREDSKDYGCDTY
jgi:hypothetical protein